MMSFIFNPLLVGVRDEVINVEEQYLAGIYTSDSPQNQDDKSGEVSVEQ